MILVTGASGFIGQVVVKKLLDNYLPEDIIILLNRNKSLTAENSGIKYITGGLAALPEHLDELKGVKQIVHLASKNTDAERTGFTQVNVEGTKTVIAVAQALKAERIIYLSSTGVYGHASHFNVEETAPKRPDTPFSQSKLAAEKLLQAAQIPIVILRYRFVIGVGDKFVIPGYLKALKKLPFSINKGKALISFIDVGDLAELISRFLQRSPTAKDKLFEEYHVNNGEKINISQLFALLSKQFSIEKTFLFNLPFKPLYLILRLKEILLNQDLESKNISSLNSIRLKFLCYHNFFSSTKLLKLYPDLNLKSVEEILQDSRSYYEQFLSPAK